MYLTHTGIYWEGARAIYSRAAYTLSNGAGTINCSCSYHFGTLSRSAVITLGSYVSNKHFMASQTKTSSCAAPALQPSTSAFAGLPASAPVVTVSASNGPTVSVVPVDSVAQRVLQSLLHSAQFPTPAQAPGAQTPPVLTPTSPHPVTEPGTCKCFLFVYLLYAWLERAFSFCRATYLAWT